MKSATPYLSQVGRNCPFQGLAADGAKLAMWELTKAGYRIVAFVHDEFLIELPVAADFTNEARRIETICCETMQQLTGEIPIICEFALARKWYKQAESVFDVQGRLLEWKPTAVA